MKSPDEKSPGGYGEIPLCMVVAIKMDFATKARLVDWTKFYEHIVGYRRNVTIKRHDQAAQPMKPLIDMGYNCKEIGPSTRCLGAAILSMRLLARQE
jgi:hypothetical protein